MSEKHTLSVLVENKPGVLTRVSALGVPYLRDAIFPEVPLSPDGVTRRSYPKLSWRPFTIWQKRGG